MLQFLLILGLSSLIRGGHCKPIKIENEGRDYPLPIVSREEWGARSATGYAPLNKTVYYVIIHHSYEPEACYNLDSCSSAMRSMQDYHQQTQGWHDIGYNFAVGSDGRVYEGRGWNGVGAHTVGYNNDSIGIVLIGNWLSKLPPLIQLQAAQKLIYTGVLLHRIKFDYALIGHQQVADTECPGAQLFEEIVNWKNFDNSLEYAKQF